MKLLYNHHAVLQDWELFHQRKPDCCNNVRAEILESWLRSDKYELDHNRTILPEPLFAKATEIYEEDWVYGQKLTAPYLVRFYDLLKETDSAIFYITSDLMIVSQRGSEVLLKSLNSKNIGIGTDLNEKIIGTNAAALAAITNSDAYTVGAEHFSEAFHEYGCSVTHYDRPASILKDYHGYIMIVTYRNDFNYYHLSIIRQFADILYSSASFKLQQVKSLLLNSCLEKGFMEDQSGLIFVDHRGIILHTNEFIIKKQLGDANLIGKQFDIVFPELNDAINFMNKGKSMRLKEVPIRRQDKYIHFFMDVTPIYEGEMCAGMIVSLQEKSRVHNTLTMLANYTAHFCIDDLIGSSQSFTNAKNSILLAAESPSNVLITGETGTGKELFAQAIHNASKRSNAPFVSLNCAAIPRELIGSELFGYVEGAFTGARKGGAIGKFELADKGTIFLDEIGDMPIDMQSTLLRVLEEHKITRIGGTQQIPIEVKIIAATNKNLLHLVDENEFRLDLYYRLNVIKIDIPPLRIRKDDIPELAHSFIDRFNGLLNKNISGMTEDVMDYLKSHQWPGNVRELRNIIERAVNHCNSPILSVNNLPRDIFSESTPHNLENANFPKTIIEDYRDLEYQKIMALMMKYNGNKSKVAQELGITRTTLYKKLKGN